MSNRYLTAGTRVRITASFRDHDGTPTSPATVFVRYSRNGGVSVDAPMTADGVGEFHADVLIGLAGEWKFEVHGAGGLDVVSDRTLTVTASAPLPAP